MMKFDIMFLVTRLNGQVIDVTALKDDYTYCSIDLDSEDLTDDDIRKFYSYMGEKYAELKVSDVRKQGYIYSEQEAKDLTCKLSKYSISIEHKEIDFKDEEQSDE